MNLKELSKPFPAADIEWRIGQGGVKQNGDVWATALAYVTNRAIMDRLDEVCGPENWQNEYKASPSGGVLCGISIYIEDRGIGDRWVTKWDGAENTEIESVKGGLSGSMKRSGVQWGIGRYLYDLPMGWANIVQQGTKNALKGQVKDKSKKAHYFHWLPPQLPTWALPKFKDLAPIISEIKDGISKGDYRSAQKAWSGLTDDEKSSLWKAPSKGGVFTTREREIMKTSEFKKGKITKGVSNDI